MAQTHRLGYGRARLRRPCGAGKEGGRWRRFSAFSTTIRSTAIRPSIARDDLPAIERYPDGQTLPTPRAIDFAPGQLLGSVSGELGLRNFLEAAGHELVVTSDKDGPDSAFERELVDADIVISQPFWPAYLTAERIAKAPKLKLAITAGIGSDHVDLQAAIDRGITVAEVTYCNSISVAEHVVMAILAWSAITSPRTMWPAAAAGTSPIAPPARYDVEGMHVGTVAAGRIGLGGAAAAEAVRRPSPLLRPPPRCRAEVEAELGVTCHDRGRGDGAASATW